MLTVTRFVSLALGALNLGLAWAHLVEMGPKRAMSGPEWLATQRIYRDFGKVAGITVPTALLSTLTTLALVRRRRPATLLTALGGLCTAATVAIWAWFNEPVNRELVEWQADALPADWERRRDQWEFAHAASAALHTVSLAALLVAALRDGTTVHQGAAHMRDRIGRAAAAPRWVTFWGPIAKVLLAAGVPLGFNGLITIRGRQSGLPRTTPVAIIAVLGRRWVWAPWGDVQWVRNLRAAGHATITARRRKAEVTAMELDPTQRVAFFRDVLGPLARSIPFGVWFIRTFDQVDLDDPVAAAEGRPVFELHPLR